MRPFKKEIAQMQGIKFAPKLSPGQIYALENPIFGYRPGSNIWPLVALRDEDDNEVCTGEEIDMLLRDGLLEAVPLHEPLFVEAGGGDYPDNECTHEINVTEAGRRAIQGGGDGERDG